jgi:RNA polymerase sigma-70 factor (ECF subfamily)
MSGFGDELTEAARDREAHRRFELLYRERASELRRRVGAQLRSADEAGDVVQEAFARLLRAQPAERLREPGAFLNRIVRNLLIDRRRRLVNRAVHVPPEGEDEPATPPSQAHGLELADMRERYRAAVDTLPARTREVFILHRVKELSYADIARKLGISIRTVEWHMAQAIMRLGKELDGS